MKRWSLILCFALLAVFCRAQIIINGDDGTVTIDGVTRSLYEESEPSEPQPDLVKLSSGWVINKDNCTISKDGKTFKLYGKVRIVDSFEDIKVRLVDSFEDVDIRLVNGFEGSCGKVRLVDSFEEVKVRIVDSFEDIKVRLVDGFEGIR